MSNFNPRSRVGSDIGQHRTIIMRQVFQSTLPRGERLTMTFDLTPETFISIHAPAWGATPVGVVAIKTERFQSTLPRGERPFRIFLLLLPYQISIHAPAWGATLLASVKPSIGNISIHAPAWGATSCKYSAVLVVPFQSTLPRGERPWYRSEQAMH